MSPTSILVFQIANESLCHVVPGSSTSTSMGVKAKNLKIDANGDLRFSTVATFMEVVQVRRTSS